jgi:cyclic pyranopterin phosphate synthase
MSERRRLTHLDGRGKARMVDVSAKQPTARRARAQARVHMRREALDAVRAGTVPKGDVLAVARIAGIQAAKQTAVLVPLCHVLPLDSVQVEARVDVEGGAVVLESEVRCRAATGVEMEAVVAVTLAAIAVYDMCKALDRSMRIEAVELLEKSGGRSGHYRRRNRA